MQNIKTYLAMGYFAVTSILTYKLIAQQQKNYFSAEENKDKLLKTELMDINGDKIPDSVLGHFDMNKNGKVDTYAGFLLQGFKPPNDYVVSDRAFGMAVDFDEDGTIDAFVIDSDMDGSLDKELRKQENIKGLKTI